MVFFQKNKRKEKNEKNDMSEVQDQKMPINITAEPSRIDPSLCKFVLDRPLYDGATLSCNSFASAEGSPLFESLLGLAEVKEILVTSHILTVRSSDPTPNWRSLGKKIGEILRSLIQNEVDLIPTTYSQKQREIVENGKYENNHDRNYSTGRLLHSPEGQEIQKLLEEQINPAVASHGGKITLHDYRDGVAFVKMEGGCQGCGQAALTLRQGVERAIKQQIPYVKEVVDVTDHANGTDPYFR